MKIAVCGQAGQHGVSAFRATDWRLFAVGLANCIVGDISVKVISVYDQRHSP